jgi:hypothetical protein
MGRRTRADGHRNLLRSPADVIGSTANYIANGLKWRRGEPWLQEVRVPQNLPSGFPWDQADLAIQLPRAKWAQFGVTYPDGRALPNDDLPASLLLPMGRMGPAFLAYPNFAAYTEWNNSLIYSTTAGYLATRIAGAPAMRHPAAPVAQLPFAELREMQQLLVRAGFNVGKVDGIMGQQSRTAVKAMQIKYGLPADSWPTAELLARMRGQPRAQSLPPESSAALPPRQTQNLPINRKSTACPSTTLPFRPSCKFSIAFRASSPRPRHIARRRIFSPTFYSAHGFSPTCCRCRVRSSSPAISPPKAARA